MNSTGLVTLADLAETLGRDHSSARKLCNRLMPQLGLQWKKVRSAESRGQTSIALHPDDAERLLTEISRAGFVVGDNRPEQLTAIRIGVFYLIQLVPDLSEKRVKMGYADFLDARVSQHKTAAPTARVIDSWPCRATWESACIASATRVGCLPISGEVFDCDDMPELIARIEAFFNLMPSTI